LSRWRQKPKDDVCVEGQGGVGWESGVVSYLVGVSRSAMRPLMKVASAPADSLMASASLEMVSFCISSSRTLRLLAFSAAAAWEVAAGIMAVFSGFERMLLGRKEETGGLLSVRKGN